MKVIIADCSAIYTGRGDTSLPRGVRSIIVKEDGSVSIHNDVGNKPLNYMKEAQFSEVENADGEIVWNFDSRKESLSIVLHRTLMMTEMPLMQNDPGLIRDGTENHLQEWISRYPELLGEGYRFVEREFATGNGPVDLLVLDAKGLPVVVEVKRVAMLTAVDQCRRYVEAVKDQGVHDHEKGFIDFSHARGMIAAVDIRPKTLEWAKKKDIEPVLIPSTWKSDYSYTEESVDSPELEEKVSAAESKDESVSG